MYAAVIMGGGEGEKVFGWGGVDWEQGVGVEVGEQRSLQGVSWTLSSFPPFPLGRRLVWTKETSQTGGRGSCFVPQFLPSAGHSLSHKNIVHF